MVAGYPGSGFYNEKMTDYYFITLRQGKVAFVRGDGMIIHEDEGYYLDRIHIISWCSKWTLEKQLPIYRMIGNCKSLNIIKLNKQNTRLCKSGKTSSNKILNTGYRSKIEIIAPTMEFLRLLSENEAALGKGYRFSYVEITHDFFCESAGDAELKADILFDTLRKKYSFSHVHTGRLIKTRKERLKDRIRGLYALRTFYSSMEKEKGQKRGRFIYVIYARRSKINNRYCTHSEWRITSSGLIKKKAHIMTVKDLCSFDFEKFFMEKESQYLVYEKINILALDKWLKGYDGRREAFTAKQSKYAGLTALHYMGFRIVTYSDLVLHFKSEKEFIKQKRGVRTEWEKRLMSLSSYERFRGVQ